MVVNTTLLTVAKYGFFGLTITCAGVLIAMTTIMKHEMVPDDFSYNDPPSLPYQNSGSIFDRHFSHCLTVPANPFCLKDPNQSKALFHLRGKIHDPPKGNSGVKKATSGAANATRELFGDFLKDFCSLMASLGLRSFLIEPSMLFCLMSPAAKLRLLTDGFVPSRTLGRRNVVTFGAMSEEAMTIDEDSALRKVLSAGFEVSRSRRWHGPWLSGETLRTTHYFFLRGGFMAHLVAFFESGNFFWHSDLSPEDGSGLLFREESLYEKFSLLPFGDGILPGLSIPSDPQFFLLQIRSSRVLLPLSELKELPGKGAALTEEMTRDQMSFRAFVAIEDFKNRLRPEGITFWMRSLSLLGWYLHGDIFSILNRLSVAAHFRALNDSTVRSLFFDNEYLTMESRFGSPDQDFGYDFDCHGLVVSLSIGREDKNGFISVQERGDLVKRTTYPKFELCSADVVGQKMLVPCKPEEIFTAEFGDQWREMFSFLDS